MDHLQESTKVSKLLKKIFSELMRCCKVKLRLSYTTCSSSSNASFKYAEEGIKGGKQSVGSHQTVKLELCFA